jgi:hypothetical protein
MLRPVTSTAALPQLQADPHSSTFESSSTMKGTLSFLPSGEQSDTAMTVGTL